ncbi:hypothetical protein V6N11_082642 [Hibiscus sabdariffa]|uniref:Uncharacterized protein n=1 Tax=Hibiscus sabdariffa TaxID=183260 RepID=A0ABR2P9N8_9ROSI
MRIVLKQERKQYVIEEHVPNEPGANAPRADKDMFKKHLDDMIDVGCLMLATMTPELQKQHEDMVAYEMIHNLKEIYERQARQQSRYGYTYLMRHKSEALEKFKEFKNEVQNQHGKSIKALRSDR